MPRTVPKTVARAVPPNSSNANNKDETLRIKTFSSWNGVRAAAAPQLGWIRDCEKRGGAFYAAAGASRGGGERGSVERAKSKGCASWTGDLTAADEGMVMSGGRTKAIEVTAERSESWQQDMEQAIMPAM